MLHAAGDRETLGEELKVRLPLSEELKEVVLPAEAVPLMHWVVLSVCIGEKEPDAVSGALGEVLWKAVTLAVPEE